MPLQGAFSVVYLTLNATLIEIDFDEFPRIVAAYVFGEIGTLRGKGMDLIGIIGAYPCVSCNFLFTIHYTSSPDYSGIKFPCTSIIQHQAKRIKLFFKAQGTYSFTPHRYP